MFFNALLTATVIGAATAQVPNIMGRDILESRQMSIGPECQSAVFAAQTIYAEAPSLPTNVISALPTEPCVTPSLTGKLETEYESYISAASQWSSSHSSELNRIVTACSSEIDTSIFCSTAVPHKSGAEATATATATATSGSDSSAAAQTHAPTGAAPRETGLTFAAGAAIAGFMGESLMTGVWGEIRQESEKTMDETN
ncbi:hypothetical protein GGR50DRAFT_695137 [Xylaria sp. CBS 124048]|nr:hypothetical protein GGR50DRAFT_695137 [Xylaria sp. CBS 124048]